jgi:hypothetical protein
MRRLLPWRELASGYLQRGLSAVQVPEKRIALKATFSEIFDRDDHTSAHLRFGSGAVDGVIPNKRLNARALMIRR